MHLQPWRCGLQSSNSASTYHTMRAGAHITKQCVCVRIACVSFLILCFQVQAVPCDCSVEDLSCPAGLLGAARPARIPDEALQRRDAIGPCGMRLGSRQVSGSLSSFTSLSSSWHAVGEKAFEPLLNHSAFPMAYQRCCSLHTPSRVI